MKIAQVTAYWGAAYPTGSGVFCYELSKRLAKQFEVHVFTSGIGNFNNLSNTDNLHVHPLHTYCTIWDMNPLANVFTKLLQNDFDIIHVHSYIFFLSNMAALARLFKRKSRYILHFHGGWTSPMTIKASIRGGYGLRNTYMTEHWAISLQNWLTKCLATQKNDISIIKRKFGVEEVEWIPNAVDTEKFTPAEEKPNLPVVTYVGKLEKWKGIDTLIKSFEIVNRHAKNIKFLVVGTGSLESKLREAKLPIEFMGPVPYDEMPIEPTTILQAVKKPHLFLREIGKK